MQELPAMAGIELANWNWKVVHQFVSERFSISLSRSGCLNYLHRLGFVLEASQEAIGQGRQKEAGVLRDGVRRPDGGSAADCGAKIFFADEAHFRADAGLRGKWVLKGEPALVDSSSPRWGEQGQLLLGSVPGDRRGGVDGTGG